jgi:hypothetical protein
MNEFSELRSHVPTVEFARCLGVQPATIRRGLCVDGHYMNLKPVKLPNRRLLWPMEEIKRILEGRS